MNTIYGGLLKPEDCLFTLMGDDDGIKIFIQDINDLENDDVHDVLHPDFDTHWLNIAENVFIAQDGAFESKEDAIKWCLSIGMIKNSQNYSLNKKMGKNMKKNIEKNLHMKKSIIIGIPILIILIIFISANTEIVEPGHEGILITNPIFYGEDGVNSEPLEPGRHYLAPTSKVVQSEIRPKVVTERFDDLITKDNNPVDFDVSITFQINKGKSPIMYDKYGEDWYDKNVKPQLRNIVRDNAKGHTMFELTSDPIVTSKLESVVGDSIISFINRKGIPITIMNIAVGKVSPPQDVIAETAKTAAQVQRVKTENERVKAELARTAAEKAKADADRAYILNSGMAIDQYLRLRELEIQKEKIQLIKDKQNVSIILGDVQPVMPMK
jgi:regulator of protease activity HflC (stomatin/prohibitin superfamily)